MQRRTLIRAAVSGATTIAIGPHALAAKSLETANAGSPRRLVVVFLRGAVDGLSVVVPHSDPQYAAHRPDIGLQAPGKDGGALPLDKRFGLHPALAPLLPLWDAGRLGFVHACGSPDPTRSHFDAQDYMESATPGRKTTADGWMNRLLGQLPHGRNGSPSQAPTQAISVGPVLPRIYTGPQPVANLASGNAATKPDVLDRPKVGAAFDRMYAGSDAISSAYQASRQAHREVMQSLSNEEDLTKEMAAANNGAPLPNGFPADAARLARLMRNDDQVQLAFMALGGWDTHANQGNATGQLANRLQPLGQGLAALAQGLGPVFEDTVVLVMSEFGRTVRQNGNGGTDHGHGNVLWALGGPVQGGKVHGHWPGLDTSALYEERDLAVTTDFRSVVAQVATRHMRLSDRQLTRLLPGFSEASLQGQSLSLIKG